MKRILFLFGLLVCLAGMPLTAFADNKTAKQTYETAISDNWKTMLKNSIALDTINAENNTHLLNWQDVKNPSDEAVKLVEKIRKLQAEQEEDQESMDPYTKAKKTCDEKLNADGECGAGEYYPDPERPSERSEGTAGTVGEGRQTAEVMLE